MNASIQSSLAYEYAHACTSAGVQPIDEFTSSFLGKHDTCRLVAPNGLAGPSASASLEICAKYLPQVPVSFLTVRGWEVSQKALQSLVATLASCPQLKGLVIDSCVIQDGSLVEVLEVLAQRTHFEKLGLVNVQAGDSAVMALTQGPILGATSALRKLTLGVNNITGAGVRTLVEHLSSPSGANTALKELDVSGNAIGDDGARLLGTLLSGAAPVRLDGLFVDQCGISPVGAEDLLRQVGRGHKLREISLSGNQVGDAAFSLLSGILDTGGALEELNAARTSASDEALASLFDHAASHPQLRALDVSGQPLGPAALRAATRMIQSSATLRRLRLDVAAPAESVDVARAVGINPSLIDVSVGGAVDPSARESIARRVKENASVFAGPVPGAHAVPDLAQANAASFMEATTALIDGSLGSNPRPVRTNSQVSGVSWSGLSQSASQVSGTRSLRPGLNRPTTPTGSTLGRERSAREQGPTLTAGGAASVAAKVFNEVDVGHQGSLDLRGMVLALTKLGVLDGYTQKEVERIARNEFRIADISGNGKINLDEFTRYYTQLLASRAQELRNERLNSTKLISYPPGYRRHEELREVFATFAAFGGGHGKDRQKAAKEMDGSRFSKLCKDGRLVEPDGPLSQSSVDIIFARAKPKSSKRIDFKHFLRALAMVAQEVGVSFEEVVESLGVQPLALDVAWKAPSRRSSLASSMVSRSRVSGMSSQMGASAFIGLGGQGMTSQEVADRARMASSITGGGARSAVGSAAGGARPLPGRSPSMTSQTSGTGFFRRYYKNDRAVNTAAAEAAATATAEDTSAMVTAYLNSSAPMGAAGGSQVGAPSGVGGAGLVTPSITKQPSRLGSTAGSQSPLHTNYTTPASDTVATGPGAVTSQRVTAIESMARDALQQLHHLEQRFVELGRAQENVAAAANASAGAGAGAGAGGAALQALTQRVAALERGGAAQVGAQIGSLLERQARIEQALLSIAQRVDQVDKNVKAEQEQSLKALEAILSASKALMKT